MKTMKWMMTMLAALALSPTLYAHAKTGQKAGPNGGRMLSTVEPNAEFFVTPEGKVRITFVDKDGKAAAVPEKAEVTLTGGDRANPTKLAFAKDGETLVSDKPLPEGKNVPIVLRIKLGEKAVTEKFGVNLADCAECKHKEYACTCAHAE